MKTIILIFTLLTFTTVIKSHPVEPKLEQRVASQAEINEYLFGSPNATYLTDFKSGLSVRLNPEDAPEFSGKKDVKFGFYSKEHPERQTFTFNTRAGINDSVVNPTKPLRVIIHGWKNSGDSPVSTLITKAYLEKRDVNVMVVDWNKVASENYFVAREFTHNVGAVVQFMLKYLIDDRKLAKLETTYIIGHSLGAHTAGFVGKKLQDAGIGKLPVIFALDAAGPLFSFNETDRRLHQDDAEYVIALHTSKLLGFKKPIGHADFYANYGFSQPGCGMDLLRTCAHARSYEYFSDAITSDTDELAFWSVKCDSVFEDIEVEKCRPSSIAMKYGETSNTEKARPTGIFYFETNKKKPYSKGIASIEKMREVATSTTTTTTTTPASVDDDDDELKTRGFQTEWS